MARGESQIELRSVTPAPGSAVHREDVLSMVVYYNDAKFKEGELYIAAFVDRLSERQKRGEPIAMPYALNTSSGRLQFCAALDSVWDRPLLKWPLTVRLMLVRISSRGNTAVDAVSEAISYISQDTSPGPRADDEAPKQPEGYGKALSTVYSYFENTAEQKKACVERFPDLGHQVIQAYRRWEDLHASLRLQVTELRFRENLRLAHNDMDAATSMLDESREMVRSALRDEDTQQARKVCEVLPAYLSGSKTDPEILFRQQLVIIREYAATIAAHGNSN